MKKAPRLKADLHVHTVSSGHGYSTVREICKVASDRGLEMIGVADHGPAMPGGPYIYYFTNMVIMPRTLFEVKVLRSVECNIVDSEGNLDVPDRALEVLDLVQAGIHPRCGYDGDSIEENTRAVLGAIMGGKVDVLVHPGNPLYPLDYETVVEAAASNKVLLEINNSSFTVVRKGSEENCEIIVSEACKRGAMICVGSDAHEAELVGVFDRAFELIDQVGLDERLIVNRTAGSVLEFLRTRGKEITL